MDNRNSQSSHSTDKSTTQTTPMSPWARYWARQHRMPQDSHLVSFGDKVTYTFTIGNDVASIHFDLKRNEVFYKGHHVRSEDMQPNLAQLLQHFQTVLAKSPHADKFLDSYSELLRKLGAGSLAKA